MSLQKFKKLPQDRQDFVMSISDSIRSAFKTGGLDTEGNRITISDALSTPDSHLALERVTIEIIEEAKEPTLIGQLLLDQMYTTDMANVSQVTIRTLGNIGQEDFRVSERGEYKEVGFNVGQQNALQAIYGKYGCKFAITEEMEQASDWNLIDQWLRKIVQAMGRYKEKLIFEQFNRMGVVVFDNVNPNKATIGRTSGRNIYGKGNGSMTTMDLIDMYSHLLTLGYRPDYLIAHPLQWAMFARDPILRESGVAAGNLEQWLTTQIPHNDPYREINNWNSTRRQANGSRQELTQEETFLLNKQPPSIPPNSGPLNGLKILVSDLVPYDADKRTADLIMVDSRNTGVLVTNEPLSIDNWDNKEHDVRMFKLKERYAIALYDKGQAVAIAKNISLEPNEIFNNPHVNLTNLEPISRKD